MRLRYTDENSLQALAKQGLLKDARTRKLDFSEYCVIRKKSKVKFGTATHCTKGILDYIHTDVWRPTKMTSIGGKYYFMTFIDDFSRDVGYIP